MKLVNIELARAVQLFPREEIYPKNGAYRPDVIQLTTERYGFVYPPNIHDSGEDNTRFREGIFDDGHRKIKIAELVVYTDGVAVEAPDSESADMVLDDLIKWAKETFDIPDAITQIPRTFVSGIIVDFDGPINRVLSIFREIKLILEAEYKTVYERELNLDLCRIAFSTDQKDIPGLLNPEFQIERRVDHTYSANRYYCTGPIPTRALISTIEKLEKLALA